MMERLRSAVLKGGVDIVNMPKSMYVFVERVARVYLSRRKESDEVDLHTNRDAETFYSVKV